jgi:hypothetical protein
MWRNQNMSCPPRSSTFFVSIFGYWISVDTQWRVHIQA